MKDKINSYQDLRVFQNAMEAAMKIFQLTTTFPAEEKFEHWPVNRCSFQCAA